MDYQNINADKIDEWVKNGWEWGIPISTLEYKSAFNGEWRIFLTPTKVMPREWFPQNLEKKKILGLASGGGQQMPVFTAHKACCTVLDYSQKQLDSEKMVAEREGYSIEIVRHDMPKTLPFDNESFDIIFHPVANCYVEDVRPIFKECFRVLKKGGIFVGGFDNGVNFISNDEHTIENHFPFNPVKNPDQMELIVKDNDAVQFSHTFEELIGGQLEAGFILTNVYEDTNGSGRLHELNIPSFWATRAVKL